MSFVNMMGNDRWTDLDINRRVQAIIRSQFTAEDELKAARLARQATKTDTEQAFIEAVDSAIAAALAEGHDARVDMELLAQVLNIEECQRIVAIPITEPVLDEQGAVTNQDQIDLETTVRANCQAQIDAASPEVLALVALRNPKPEPAPETELEIQEQQT